jgi:DNA modification methylase
MSADPSLLEKNTLFYGDNLQILRGYIQRESIDLIYLDPPFNSKETYNVLFKERGGRQSTAQIQAFSDFWHWDDASEKAYVEIQEKAPNVGECVKAFVSFLGRNDITAYLVMMGIRLIELHRVLRKTGSLYIHCDPTASHYLKVILDTIFDPRNFRNEIVWKRTYAHSGADHYGPIHDTLLFYTKSDEYVWHTKSVAYSKKYLDAFFKPHDEKGHYRLTLLTGSGTRNGSSGKPWRGVDPMKVGRHWAVPGYMRPQLGKGPFPDVQSALEALDAIGRIDWPEKQGGTPMFKQYKDDLGGGRFTGHLDRHRPYPVPFAKAPRLSHSETASAARPHH